MKLNQIPPQAFSHWVKKSINLFKPNIMSNKKDEAIKRLDALDKEAQALRKIIEGNDISINDIDYPSACKLLNKIQYTNDRFITAKQWAEHQLETIIEAVNHIDNDNKPWKPEFDSHKTNNYIPYFERKNGSWVVLSVSVRSWGSYCSVGLYFKKQESARIISNKFLELYNQYLG